MPKPNSKKPQRIDFNDYLALVMSLKGDSLKEWNRKSIERSRLLQKEMLEVRTANIQKYLQTPGAAESLADQIKQTGEINLKLEIDMEAGECRLRVRVGDVCGDLGLLGGDPTLDRITVKRFLSLINQHLISASLSLFEATAIYGSETVQKSHPLHWRRRFMNEEVKRLEELTGKPRKLGRPAHVRKSSLRKEDETNELKANVILAVKNLYGGKSELTYYCPKHKHGTCPGHDFEEINISLAAEYLHKSAGTLRNQLSKAKMKFRNLKREALASVTD